MLTHFCTSFYLFYIRIASLKRSPLLAKGQRNPFVALVAKRRKESMSNKEESIITVVISSKEEERAHNK